MHPKHPTIDPREARTFATDVVLKLREAGFEALWAGGCVRDQLMGNQPKDYDVATNATPKQVQELFGKKTHAVGESFGVIVVVGRKTAGNVEVATFRQDGSYLDGRRPDSVVYSTAEKDAQRRDFTINGLFYDPVADEVIDYVDGQIDMNRKVIRAIGDASARIAEDKLRMLRAVRFAARFDFDIEDETRKSIKQAAAELRKISQERITAELHSIMLHPRRVQALGLLESLGLRDVLWPGWFESHQDRWQLALQMQQQLPETNEQALPVDRLGNTADEVLSAFPVAFAVRFAALLYSLRLSDKQIAATCREWKLSNDERKLITWILSQMDFLIEADKMPWHLAQPVIAHPWSRIALSLAKVVVESCELDQAGVDFVAAKLELKPHELSPEHLVNGQDLLEAGIPSGPQFKKLLDDIRAEQLYGRINSKEQAIDFAKAKWKSP